MTEIQTDAAAVLDFWFADARESDGASLEQQGKWFSVDADFDAEIRKRFGTLPERALSGALDTWLETPQGALALVLVLDQFPRNLYRGSAKAFAFDAAARAAALLVIGRGLDEVLHPLEAVFLYLPFEHSEDLGDQKTCLELFRGLEDRVPETQRERYEGFMGYAKRHYDIIARFDRFPHRNEILGRPSTPEEARYLEEGGDRF